MKQTCLHRSKKRVLFLKRLQQILHYYLNFEQTNPDVMRYRLKNYGDWVLAAKDISQTMYAAEP